MIPRKFLGAFLILLGFFFILNSFSGMTGFAVADNFGKPGSILGLVLIIVGVVVFVSRRKEKESKLERISNPTQNELKAIKEMEQGIKSGKKYKPNEASSLLKKAGYSLEPVKGDHMKVVRGSQPVRNLPTNKRPNSVAELDMGSKSYNPEGVIKTILYDFKERQFKEYYSNQGL